MTLRTPRRRVSPRTRKRYRAIKDFFKRAIGSTSQADIEINSNIAVNVTDLKHKIVGLEQQLSEVSRTCQEYIYLNGSNVGSQSNVPDSLIERKEYLSERELQGIETEILYHNSGSHCGKSDGSDYMPKHNKRINNAIESNKLNDATSYDLKDNTKIKKSKVDSRVKDFEMKQNFSKHHIRSAHRNIEPAYSIAYVGSHADFREIRHCNPGYSGDQAESRAHKREQNDHTHRRQAIHKEPLLQRDYEYKTDKHSNNRKHKSRTNELDKKFIADIIQRQYKPIKMFGRRESDLSQFSEPLCRDRERTVEDNIHEENHKDNKLCSCCYGRQNCPKIHRRCADSDTRSVCDTRLYSSKKFPRHKHRKAHADAYNCELYDLVPVKEKSSPKSRRKFAYENFANNHTYREVPPSPRTHRPRLNLKAQCYTEEHDFTYTAPERARRVSPKRQLKYQKPKETFYSDTTMPTPQTGKNKQQNIIRRQNQGTMSSLHHVNTEVTDTEFNRTQAAVSPADKTDQALCEIKDILQTFLQEIKKDASTSGKSDISTKITEAKLAEVSQDRSANIGVNSSSFNNYSVPQSNIPSSPFMPPYMNPCCYPVLPMYPMSPINCTQNGYTIPSQSFTCGCPNKPYEAAEISKTNTGNETLATETDELIKEIYKYVAQSPKFSRKQEVTYKQQTRDGSDKRFVTSRSAGGSGPVCQHDAKVGTMANKCYSKSCEAMGSRILADTYEHYNETATSYSDTVLESLETTAISSSKTELSTEPSDKAKKTKFSKVLKSFGFFKKKQRSESESTIEVDIKKKTPYRQEVTDYAVHSQEYYRPPPVRQDHRYCHHQESFPSARDHRSCRHHDHHSREPREYHPPYNPMHYPPHGDPYHDPRVQQTPRSPQYHPVHPTAPPYGYEHYNQMQPQIPLCLKEIEVKTMGTQSERKISFFNKIKQKIQTPIEQARIDGGRNFSSQTAKPAEAPPATKPGFWKTWQAKAMEGKQEPISYSYKQQEKLANGDTKMRNAMLKKMFHKRNPLSPGNLIIRTLLGRDKSSFGEPPTTYRPRMFF